MVEKYRTYIENISKETGFIQSTLEKVERLIKILEWMNSDEKLNKLLALKGGTAINLAVFNFPRLSVDIDLDLAKNLGKEEMIKERENIHTLLVNYLSSNNYKINMEKSKNVYALDSIVAEYTDIKGNTDNIKIEINYMNRIHILETKQIKVNTDVFKDKHLTIHCIHPIEIFAAKICALLSRTTARDLYDVYTLSKYDLFDNEEKKLLKKCFMLEYIAVNDYKLKDMKIDNIEKLKRQDIKTKLLPTLKDRNPRKSNVDEMKIAVKEYLKDILIVDEKTQEFYDKFQTGVYEPELLFDDKEIVERIKGHPMIIWKLKYITQTKGDASADIAHFSFYISEKSSDSLTIDLAKTRLPNDTTSVEGTTVAPGTKGALAFDINANTSDVSLKYNIDIDITEVPQNLIFYSDKEMTRAIYHSSNSININGFFNQNTANKAETRYIYWNWPLETGQTQEEIDGNDLIDSTSMGTAITANIHVIGEQVREIPTISQLIYNANGGDINGYGNSEKVTKTIINNNIDGTTLTASRPGYEFGGWSENLLEGVTFTEQYIQPNANITSADYNNLLSDYISVEQGATYEFSLSHNETTVVDWYGYAWYSDTEVNSIIGTRHSGYFPTNFEGFTLNIVAPEGAKYLRIGARHMNVGSSQGGVVITSANYSLISYDKKLSLDLLDGVGMTATYIDVNNQIVSADRNNLLSDYIQVEEGATYEFYLSHNKTTVSDWYGYAWYTDTEVNSVIGSRYVGSFSSEYNEGFTINVTAPQGAKYLRIGARHMNVGSSQGGDAITSAVYSLRKSIIENRILYAIWTPIE